MSRQSKKRRQQEEAEREALLAPDAFEERGSAWSTWAERNLKFVLGGLVAALVLVAMFELFRSSGSQSAEEHTQALIEALDAYREAVSLQNVLTSTIASEHEKRFRDARSKLAAVLADGPPDAVASLARLYDGDLARRLGEHGAAIKGYDQYLGSTGPGDDLVFFALEGKGYALEAQGKADEALSIFRRIEGMETYADFGLKHVARILLAKGDTDGAKAAFKKIIERDPASLFKDFAEQQLATLE